MSPQPRNQPDKEPTAEDVGKDRQTPDPPEDKPTFTVADLRGPRGETILHGAYRSPDIAGAFHGVPDSREITVADAKKRVKEWLAAPIKTESA